jgi:hypothetical protein
MENGELDRTGTVALPILTEYFRLRRGELLEKRASSPCPSPPSDGREGIESEIPFLNSTAVDQEDG